MALDHLPVQPTAGKSVLFTIPSGVYNVQVTIQNRHATDAVSIGDDTLGAVSGANAGIAVAANGGLFQMTCNAGDTIYVYAANAFATTNFVVVLLSYGKTLTPNAQ